jgi:tetratricopeptide (TPR) repeat protein
MSYKQSTFHLSAFILILILLINFSFSYQANAECLQGNCNNGYGVFIFEDGRIYEGQWAKELFDGMGSLTFLNGSKYIGEFKKGNMHGFGSITLQDGSKHKCTFENNIIEGNNSIKVLWEKATSTQLDQHIFYCQKGDVYSEYGNYEKSLDYYNKSLKINPDYQKAINKKNKLEKKLVELESKSDETPQIIFHGNTEIEPGTHSQEWIEQGKRISEKANTRQKVKNTYRKYNKTNKYEESNKTDNDSKKPDVKVLSHDFHFLGSVGDSWKFQWKVKLINNSDQYGKVYIKFKILDYNGSTVDWTNEWVTIMPNETQKFYGTSYIEKRLKIKAKKSSVEISVYSL